MSINECAYPEYDLPDQVTASSPEQLRALADPLRSTLLDLVLERPATINELALAVERPKSTVAHHVAVLVEAGLLRVVLTRRVKAIDEPFYGRTGRTIVISPNPARPDTAGPPRSACSPRPRPRRAYIPTSVARSAMYGSQPKRQLRSGKGSSTWPRASPTSHVAATRSTGSPPELYPTTQPALPDREDHDD